MNNPGGRGLERNSVVSYCYSCFRPRGQTTEFHGREERAIGKLQPEFSSQSQSLPANSKTFQQENIKVIQQSVPKTSHHALLEKHGNVRDSQIWGDPPLFNFSISSA